MPLTPDTFAEVLTMPEFSGMRPAERAAVFDAGLKDLDDWMAEQALDDDMRAAFAETRAALGTRYRPAQSDIELDRQSPLGTGWNAFKNFGPEVVGGTVKGLAQLGDAAAETVGLSDPKQKSWLDNVASFAEGVIDEGKLIRPTNPANPIAAAIGNGAGQAVGLLGTAAIGVPALGMRAITAVPIAMGFGMGAGQGVDTAEAMGIESPAGKLAMGTAFGGIEAATEAIGGVGGRLIPVGKGLVGAGKNIAVESAEEVLAGTLQDATTAGVGQFMTDPNRPGFTENGYQLPKLDAAFVERRKQEAIGGAAGGAVFAGVQSLVNLAAPEQQPVAEDVSAPPDGVLMPAATRQPLLMRPGGTGVLSADQTRGAAYNGPSAEEQAQIEAMPGYWDRAQAQIEQQVGQQVPAASVSPSPSLPVSESSAPIPTMQELAMNAGRDDSTTAPPNEAAEMTLDEAAALPDAPASTRLQFSKNKPLRNNFNEVRAGDPVAAVKKHMPVAADAMPRLSNEQTTDETTAVAVIEQMLVANPVITDAQGKRVLLANQERGSLTTRARHLAASHAVEDRFKKGPRIYKAGKAASAAAVPQTVQDYHLKAEDKTTGTILYLRRYKDGVHAVITDNQGSVSDFGEVDASLLTQRRPDGKDAFRRFVVVDKRTPGMAPSLDRARVSQTQEPAQQQLPRTQLSATTAKVKTATRKAVTDALKILADRLPGLQHGRVLAFANADEFLSAGYAGAQSFTAEEIASMADAEAFFDQLTGHTIVFTDQISIREGETPMRAVARVLLHERVGHEGVNTLLQQDASARDRWNKIASLIPAAELDGIAAEAGYTHLAGDRAQLALEWLARQVESVEGARSAIDIERSLAGTARQLWQALKEMLARAFAGFSRSAAFAHEVHEIINLARDAAMKGSADPTTPAGLLTRVQFSLGGTRVQHYPGEFVPAWIATPVRAISGGRINLKPSPPPVPFRVNDRVWRSILSGSSLPAAFHDTIQTTERERRALDQASAQIGNDLKAAAEGYATRSGLPIANVYEMLNQALSGAPGANAVLMQVDTVLHTRALAARRLMDQMSVAIAATMPVGPLRNAIVLNQGAWMKRAYAAFDAASGWNYDNLTAAAMAGRELNGRPAADILRAAQRFLRVQNPQASAAEIEADLRDLMDRETWSNAMAGGAAVRKNVSSLITRRDIPKELRDVMGEEHNPVKRFQQSTGFQAQFIHRHQQQVAMRRIGLANGLFQTARGGVYNVQVPAENARWSGLNGVWTTPQLWEAMQEMNAAEGGTDLWSKTGEALKFLGNEAKLNRVAMNPDSWIVNMLGNVVALVQTGDVFYASLFRRVGEAVGLHRSGKGKPGDAVNAATEAVTEAQRALVARLTASGVIGETFTLRDLEASMPRHLLAWVNEDTARDRTLGALKGAIAGQAAGRGLGIAGRLVGGAVGAAVGGKVGLNTIQQWQQVLAGYVMTGPDAIGRLTGFLGNYEVALAAGMAPDAAFAHASERTRNTFPDYGKLPALLKTLSKYGVAGSFIGFQYEVYRNTIWNLRYAAQDLRSGNAALVAKGIRRTMGASAVGILAAGGLQAIFQGLAGTDDERNKKWRKWFGAPWERNGVIVFTDYNDKAVSYFNTNYLIPQATLAELINAAAAGADPAEAAGNVAGHVWEQFMGSSVHLGPILAASMNVDRNGRPLTHKDGAAGVAERVDYAMQTMLEPGWAAKFERLEYAMREAEKKGRLFSVEEEIKRFIGIREFTRTWPDMVKRGFDNFAQQNSNVRSQANKQLGLNLPGVKDTAVQDANAALDALRTEMTAYESDLKQLGVPDAIIRKSRQDSSVPKTFHNVEIDPVTKNRVRSTKN